MATAAWAAASVPAAAAFGVALDDPERAQRVLLRRYLRRNEGTAFGREHRLDRVDSIDAYRRAVPVRDYDGFTPWVDRIAAGEANVLTADPVTRLVPSGGSTRAAKWVPYTAGLSAEFNRAVGPWIVDLYGRRPWLAGGPAYWSVTPAVAVASAGSVVPVGFDDDAAYLGGVRRRLVDAALAVPSSVRHEHDVDRFRFATMANLLRRADLRVMSVWHPSFLELLLDFAAAHWGELLAAVGDRRRAAELAATGPDWAAVWPRLGLVSCWADAHAAGPAAALAGRLPQATVQPKGLLATEAFVSVPFAGAWPVAVRSHWFEFEDDGGRWRGVEQLQIGGEYGVAVTTAGGLWRYRLGDRVRCEGFVGRTPSVRFVGRADLVVDRFGEKLSEGFVGSVVRGLVGPVAFALLAPDGAGYTLFVQGAAAAGLAGRLDRGLSANPHYAYCRQLGQLAAARVFGVSGGAYAAFVRRRLARGQRLGDIKAVAVDGADGWAGHFAGSYVE